MPLHINGITYTPFSKKTKTHCFISICNNYFLKQFKNKRCYIREYKTSILMKDTKNFIPIIDNFYKNDNYYIKYPFYNNSIDLFEISMKNQLSDKAVNNLFYECIKPVKKLHENKIIHLDIKPDNYLSINNDINDIKIIDLEYCQKIYDNSLNENNLQTLSHKRGTLSYVSPEVLDGYTGYKTDVWNLGILYYMLKKKSFPYSQNRVERRNCVKKYNLKINAKDDKNLSDILDMTIVRYDKRCSLDELMSYVEREVLI